MKKTPYSRSIPGVGLLSFNPLENKIPIPAFYSYTPLKNGGICAWMIIIPEPNLYHQPTCKDRFQVIYYENGRREKCILRECDVFSDQGLAESNLPIEDLALPIGLYDHMGAISSHFGERSWIEITHELNEHEIFMQLEFFSTTMEPVELLDYMATWLASYQP